MTCRFQTLFSSSNVKSPMTRVLLTGGSGFIATHILQILLERGYSVVTTVRSASKAEGIRKVHPNYGTDKLDFVIVPDVSRPNAFDEAVVSDPPFDAVIHTASPFHFNVTDIKTDLLDPAIVGTTGILLAIKKHAPSVKRVVITSSFGSMMDVSKGLWPEHTYSDQDWNPVTMEEALSNPGSGYSASKTFAEKAAWDFVKEESPNFSLATILPPLVFGPALQSLADLDALNTSNQFIRSFTLGAAQKEIPPTTNPIFADVRDVATAHVQALQLPGSAANKRFFIANGYCSNRQIIEIIRKHFPEYRERLPDESIPGGELPDTYRVDVRRSIEDLGLEYKSLEECIFDTVRSFASIRA